MTIMGIRLNEVGGSHTCVQKTEASARATPRTFGPEPEGTACSQCGKNEGSVYLIRDPFKGVRAEPLHEGCAPLWFARGDA